MPTLFISYLKLLLLFHLKKKILRSRSFMFFVVRVGRRRSFFFFLIVNFSTLLTIVIASWYALQKYGKIRDLWKEVTVSLEQEQQRFRKKLTSLFSSGLVV